MDDPVEAGHAAVFALMSSRAPIEARDAVDVYATLPAIAIRGEWPGADGHDVHRNFLIAGRRRPAWWRPFRGVLLRKLRTRRDRAADDA
ncbi:MAG TPA: hypothetical protein VGX03_29020 [Candidatus Binatia bacterium]|jgi:hypothetical protein|nr:hypothetical protein [Candidatus Binatia bacterium]